MMNWIIGALATFRFELKRSFSVQRMTSMLGLILFPPVILWVFIIGSLRTSLAGDALEFVLFTLIFLVALVCLLSLLLAAAPNVQGELEGKTWSFVAMRPGGRIANFLGKYLLAVATSFTVSFFSLTLCVVIADSFGTLGVGAEPWQRWGTLTGIFAIACFVYGAILSTIGAWFTKKAMVVGAGYLVGAETVLSMIPAVVSSFTMSYHLRRLGEMWLGWFLPDDRMEYEFIYGEPGPVWFHLVCLGSAMLLALIVGCLVVVNRQYAVGEET